jgi:hypothetical protein
LLFAFYEKVSEIDDALKAPLNFPTSETLSLVFGAKIQKLLEIANINSKF